MALTTEDKEDLKEHFSLIVQVSMNSAIRPIMAELSEQKLEIQSLRQLVVGVDGKNGLNGDVKNLKKKIASFDVKIGWATGAAVAISTVLSLFKKNIFGG